MLGKNNLNKLVSQDAAFIVTFSEKNLSLMTIPGRVKAF